MNRFAALSFAFAATCMSAWAGEGVVTVSAYGPTASGGQQLRSTEVAYTNFDLNNPQSLSVLLDRIRLASRAVCKDWMDQRGAPNRARDFAACQERAASTAIRGAGLPALTALASR